MQGTSIIIGTKHKHAQSPTRLNLVDLYGVCVLSDSTHRVLAGYTFTDSKMNVQLCLSTCHDRDFSTPVFKGKLNVTVETSPWTVLSGLSQINVITNVLGNLLHDDDPPSTVYHLRWPKKSSKQMLTREQTCPNPLQANILQQNLVLICLKSVVNLQQK